MNVNSVSSLAKWALVGGATDLALNAIIPGKQARPNLFSTDTGKQMAVAVGATGLVGTAYPKLLGAERAAGGAMRGLALGGAMMAGWIGAEIVSQDLGI